MPGSMLELFLMAFAGVLNHLFQTTYLLSMRFGRQTMVMYLP